MHKSLRMANWARGPTQIVTTRKVAFKIWRAYVLYWIISDNIETTILVFGERIQKGKPGWAQLAVTVSLCENRLSAAKDKIPRGDKFIRALCSYNSEGLWEWVVIRWQSWQRRRQFSIRCKCWESQRFYYLFIYLLFVYS